MEKESSERRRRNVGRRKTPLSYQLHHLKNRVLTALPSPHDSHPVLILLFLPIQFRNLFIRYVLDKQKFRQFIATIQTSWTPTKHTIQCYRLARMSRGSRPVPILLLLPLHFIRYMLDKQKFRQFNATIQTSWTPTKHTIQCYRLAHMSRGSRPVPILLLLPFHFIRYMLDKQKFRQFIATTHDFLDQTSFRKFPSCAYESGNFTNCSTSFSTFALDSSKMYTPPTLNVVSFAQVDFQFPPSDHAHCPLVISNSTAFNTSHFTQPFSNSNGSTCAQLSQENSYAIEGTYFPSCQYQRRPESNFGQKYIRTNPNGHNLTCRRGDP